MEQFISKEILDELSYCSTLGQSLKQISLSKTPIDFQYGVISIYINMIARKLGKRCTNYIVKMRLKQKKIF